MEFKVSFNRYEDKEDPTLTEIGCKHNIYEEYDNYTIKLDTVEDMMFFQEQLNRIERYKDYVMIVDIERGNPTIYFENENKL